MVTITSPAISARSASRHSEIWPTLWPGVCIHRHPGIAGTLPSSGKGRRRPETFTPPCSEARPSPTIYTPRDPAWQYPRCVEATQSRLCKHRFQQGNFEAVCVVSAVRPAMRRFDLTTDSLFAMSEPQLSSVMDPPSTIKKDLRHFAKVWCCACVITAAIQLSVLVVGAALTG